MKARLLVMPVAALLLLCAGALTAGATATGAVSAGARSVRYVYETDSSAAAQWSAFLGGLGFKVVTALAHDSSGTDMSGDDLIILGRDTGAAWSDNADAAAMQGCNRPVLGLGEGGTGFYFATGMALGLGMSTDANDVALYASSSDPGIYNLPNAIAIPPDSVLAVHTSPVLIKLKHIACLPGNVTVLAKDNSSSHAYTGLCIEDSRYMLWSFSTALPADLTAEGKALFENSVWYCMGGYPVPEVAIPPVIALSAFATAAVAPAAIAGTTRQKKQH